MATCVFTKDDFVVYTTNGICAVEDIKKMAFVRGEPEKLYYILRPKNDKNSTIFIPEDNELLISRMRAPITHSELKAIVSQAQNTECEWIEDRKERNAKYKELLSNPHPSILLPVVKAISKKHEQLTEIGKKLAAADRETFETAIRFIKDEFAFSLNNDTQKAYEYIEKAIGKIPHIA